MKKGGMKPKVSETKQIGPCVIDENVRISFAFDRSLPKYSQIHESP